LFGKQQKVDLLLDA